MRVLVLGASGPFRTEASLVRAFATLGHSAIVVDALGWRRRLGPLAARIVSWQVNRFEPELILCTRHAVAAGEPALGRILAGHPSAFWYFDALSPLPQPALALAHQTERTFASYGYQVEAFRAAGTAEVHFLPQGLDPALDRPAAEAPADYDCDLSFVGSGQFPRRHAILGALAARCRLQIRGPHWRGAPPDLPVVGGPVRGTEFARVVRGAAVSLGIDALDAQRGERAGGTSNRLWRVLGAGGCYLGEYVGGMEGFARHGVHALWYRSPSEAIDLLAAALADPPMRARIADAGRAEALARHTYAHRLERLLAGQGYTSM
jgi:hypothetical protein